MVSPPSLPLDVREIYLINNEWDELSEHTYRNISTSIFNNTILIL